MHGRWARGSVLCGVVVMSRFMVMRRFVVMRGMMLGPKMFSVSLLVDSSMMFCIMLLVLGMVMSWLTMRFMPDGFMMLLHPVMAR